MEPETALMLLPFAGIIIIVLACIILFGAAYEDKRRKTLKVGDKAPQKLLDHKPEDGPLGAFITVCPECGRIDNIWHQ